MRSYLFIVSFLLLASTIAFFALSEDTADSKEIPVIIVSIDTMRGDRVSAAGYERNITPNLDKFINNSYYFRNAYANAPWTLPSHSTILTGQYPDETGLYSFRNTLCPEDTTIAEKLKKKDYKTVSYNGDTAIHERFGLSQGFDTYNDSFSLMKNGSMPAALEFLEERETDKFFMFLHGYDVHAPYVLHRNSSERFLYEKTAPDVNLPVYVGDYQSKYVGSGGIKAYKQDLKEKDAALKKAKDAYDSEIYYTDKEVGKLFDRLKQQGIYDKSLIIVMSDHGEEFMEHGQLTHHQLYQETLKSFLAVKYPGQHKGQRVEKKVELRDVYYTVLEAVGTETGGLSLREIASSPKKHKHVYSSVENAKSVVSNKMKLIWHMDSGRYELYNLSSDPAERNDISSSEPELVQKLNDTFSSHIRDYEEYCSSGLNVRPRKAFN